MEHFLLRLIISEYAISLLASIHAMCHWLHQDNHQSRMASVPSETARGMKTVCELNQRSAEKLRR